MVVRKKYVMHPKNFWTSQIFPESNASAPARYFSLCREYPLQFVSQCFWQKMLVCFFFCIGASICIGRETLFLLYVGFFIPYLRWKLVISYSYFSMGKIIVLAFLHTLKIIHGLDNLLLRNFHKFYSKNYKQ